MNDITEHINAMHNVQSTTDSELRSVLVLSCKTGRFGCVCAVQVEPSLSAMSCFVMIIDCYNNYIYACMYSDSPTERLTKIM